MHEKEFVVRIKGLVEVGNHLFLVTHETGSVYSTFKKERIVTSKIH